MSRVFLSHSSADNREAVALRKWLVEQRPELANEIFLDIDPGSGLRVGARWKGQLFESNSRCEAVICLLSNSWVGSHECKTEYRTAEGLGKQILVARLEDTGGGDITSEWQRCDLFAGGAQTEIAVAGGPPVRFNTGALYALRKAVEGSGIGPQNFVWPPTGDPQRAPYRGWEPFEDVDAGVFFGRDAAIVRGLDELRAMRLSGLKSLFVVLGPSGSGKSSFLRAGLIPRCQREDRRFVVLGIVRPERNALTGDRGLAAAIHAGRVALGLGGAPLGEIKRACLAGPDRVVGLLAEVRAAAAARLADAGQEGAAPTLVVPLDQAEELFSADAGPQAERFLTLIAELIGRINTDESGLVVAATIRTDRYEAMQNHPALDSVNKVLFNELKPMPATQFERVITGPAGRASEAGQRLSIAPDLVARLIADAGEGADTLPLLALTLARLYADYASIGELSLAHYQAMGGMHQVVHTVIDEVLAADPGLRAQQLGLLRAAFIPWLATINPDNDEPMRRVAREGDLPVASRPLIDALVDNRLLVRDERDGQVVVEVGLESLLRQWDELAGWLREERLNLKTADDIERNAAAWAGHDHDPAWLLTGTRLTDAEMLAAAPGFGERLTGAGDYLAACRQAENQRLAAEEEQRQAELRHAQERQQTAEAHAASLRRRSRILQAVLAGTAIIAVVAVVGFTQANTQRHQAQARFRQATALRLNSEAADMLAGTTAGGDTRAFQELLAARNLIGAPEQGVLLHAAAIRATTDKIIDTGTAIHGVAVSPDGQRLASAGADHTVRLWNPDTGQPAGAPLTGHTHAVMSVAFSPDGHRIVSGSGDKTVRLWDADTGQPIGAPLTGHTLAVTSVAFSPDGHRLASTGGEGTVQLWDPDTGQPIGAPLTGHTDWVSSVAFSPNGHHFVTGADDHTLRVWNMSQLLVSDGRSVSSVAFSPDGHRLASAGADQTVRLWNPDTGQPLGAPLTGHTDEVTSVAFSPDGHRLASASADRTVRLWNAETGQPIGEPLTGHTAPVVSVAFSPDGHRLASASFDNTVRLWNAETGQPIGGPLTGHTALVFSVAFSPDGHRLASGSGDKTVRLWNPDTGQPIGAPLTGHTDPVSSVAFSPDGHRLASGSSDNTVRLWNADTGQPIGAPLTGHTDGVLSVVFSPDGHRLASGSSDKTVRLWDADTGQPVAAPLSGHTNTVSSVAFSPGGHLLASGSWDAAVRLWPATATPEMLCAKLTTNMSHKQWHDWISPDIGYDIQCPGLPIASDNPAAAPSRQIQLSFGGLNHPQAIAVDGAGDVYVADTRNNRVLLLAAGSTTPSPLPFTGLNGPDGVAVDTAGDVYVADDHNNRVLKLPVGSTATAQLTFTGLNRAGDVAVDSSRTVYVVDSGNKRVLKLSAGSTTPIELPSAGIGDPNAMAVDTAGNVYVTDDDNGRVLKLPAGSSTWTELPFGRLNGAGGVAVDPAGDVYAASYSSNQVLELPAGATAPSELPFSGLDGPSAVAVDTRGNVYVTDASGNRVLQLPRS